MLTCGKTYGCIADLLEERMIRALGEGRDQCAVFTQLSEAIAFQDSAKLDEWRARVAAWEGDDSKTNPYNIEKKRA